MTNCTATYPYTHCKTESYGNATSKVEIGKLPYISYDASTKTIYIKKGSKIQYATTGSEAYLAKKVPSCNYYSCIDTNIPLIGEYTFTEDLPNGFAIVSWTQTKTDWTYTYYGWLGYNIKVISVPQCTLEAFKR